MPLLSCYVNKLFNVCLLNKSFYQQWRKHMKENKRLIATLDMCSGYWQVPLSEKRRDINQYVTLIEEKETELN